MQPNDLSGLQCRTNEYFADQNRGTIKRNKGKPLNGVILRRDRRYEDCWRIKWDNRVTTQVLHRDFFTVTALEAHNAAE